MTTLNKTIFDSLRAGGADANFLQNFENWVNRLPSFEGFRRMSQGLSDGLRKTRP